LYGSHGNSSSSFRRRSLSQSNELVKFDVELTNTNLQHNLAEDIEIVPSDGDDNTDDTDPTDGELPEESNFSSVCIWDKYPLIGHAGSNHMPDKIEWFVFPDGPKICNSVDRPELESNYFVLNAGDDTQWYGVGITFYMRGFQTEESGSSSYLPRGNPSPDASPCDLDFPMQQGSPTEQAPSWVWMAISFCVLTKLPYVNSLILALKHIYSSSIHPILLEVEENSVGFPSAPWSLDLEGFMSLLCMDSIAPVPGLLDVAIKFPSLDGSLSAVFHGNAPHSWPYCPYNLTLPLRMVGARTMMDLIYYAMAERKIILHSTDTSKLSILSESLRVLIYPLRWCSAYIPVVPALLLDLVEAPVPYILGVSTALLSKINPTILKSVVLVNCDTGVVTTSVPINRYPDEIDRWCVMAMKYLTSTRRSSSTRCADESGTPISSSVIIQTVLLDSFVSVFSWIPECIFNIGAGYPIFNSHMFLHGYCPSSATTFAESVIDTQSFQRVVSEIHLPRLSLFVNCCKRMKYGYGYCRFLDGVRNSSTEMYPLEDRRFGLDLEENLPLGELSNPRRLLRPPYRLANPAEPPQHSPPIVPNWISESLSWDIEETISLVISRYQFSLVSEEREIVTHVLSSDPTLLETRSHPSIIQSRTSRDVAFPPLTFAVNSQATSHKKKRKHWTFEALQELWGVSSDHEGSEETETERSNERIESLKEKYRLHILMQHKLTRELMKVSKSMHVEYMFGEDVIMRLILRILPLSTSDGIHDMDLAAALQQGSDSFSQGAARRSLVTILSEYCEQISVRPASAKTSSAFTSSLSQQQQQQHLTELEIEPKFCHEKCPVELSMSAFGYALRLCKLLLQACTVHKDYLTAHGLLEICGYFYHVMFEPSESDQELSKICYIQNLRSRINRHPLYQNQTLWRTVINDAISNFNNRSKRKAKTKGKKPTTLLSALKPILIHMCGSDLSLEKMEDIMNGVASDFSIAAGEHNDLIEAMRKIWQVSKRFRSDKGSDLEDSGEQRGIRLVLHGGTPTRKQPLSPWHQISSPVGRTTAALLGDISSPASVRPEANTPIPNDGSSSGIPLEALDISRQWSVNDSSLLGSDCILELNPRGRGVGFPDRLARDIDTPSESLDIFARNVMFTPLPLEGNLIHETCVTSIDVSSTWSVSGDTCGNVNVLDLEAGGRIMQHKHNATITAVKFLPCGLIASTCSAGVLKISRGPAWQVSDSSFRSSWTKQFSYRKSILAVHRPFTSAVTSIAVGVPYHLRGRSFPPSVDARWGQSEQEWSAPSADSEPNDDWILAVGGASGGVKIYRGSSSTTRGAGGAEIMSASSPDRGSISCLSLISSSLQISATSSAQLKMMSHRTTGAAALEMDHSEHRDMAVFVSPSRPNSLWSPSQSPDVYLPGSLFIGTSKGGVVVYDLESRSSLFNCGNEDRHRALVSSILPVRTHEFLSGGFDRLVKLWDIRSKSGECVDLSGSAAAITSLTVDDYNDHKVIAACADNFIRVWDTRFSSPGRPYLILEGHDDRISCMAQKSGILITGSYDGNLRSWSLSTGRCLQKLRTDLKSPVSCLALDAKSTSLNSQDLVSISLDQSYASRKEDGSGDQPNLITLKNIWLACGGWEGSVRVWTGREV
jgi:WD40 repeat protein